MAAEAVPPRGSATELPRWLVPPGQAVGRHSNLALALRKLPPGPREDMLVFYQFCRVVDDWADEPGPSLEERQLALQTWETALRSGTGLPEDLQAVFQRHQIGPEYPLQILAGVRTDLSPWQPANFAELRSYCQRVAVAVGLVSNQITGAHSPQAAQFADALGMALQLTNILRDVREDSSRDRCYFPKDELHAAGLTREVFLQSQTPPALAEFFAQQGRRAAGYFAQARELFPQPEARALSAAKTMQCLYEMFLRAMAQRDWKLLETGISLPWWKKAWALVQC